MLILLSNDDGYFAPGLAALAESMEDFGEVVVVAPERDRSGSSNSLTLDRPVSVRRTPHGFYHVNGTPTDCVHVAVTGMLEHIPDLVVSGINRGANMGDDTVYSGTVAAATEGYLLGIPSIAVSLVCEGVPQHFETAARVAGDLVRRCCAKPLPGPVLLNVNVPDVQYESLLGVRVTRLGRRHKAEPVIKTQSPRGESMYWIGPAGDAQDAGPGTDFHAVASGFVSVTPLQIDLTHYRLMDDVVAWLGSDR